MLIIGRASDARLSERDMEAHNAYLSWRGWQLADVGGLLSYPEHQRSESTVAAYAGWLRWSWRVSSLEG